MIALLAVMMEVDNNTLMGTLLIGLIGIAATLIGSLAVIKGWIREVAGVKEVSTTEIGGQPLKVKEAKEYVTRRDHADTCAHMERRVTALEARATTIEHKMNTDKDEIIKAGEERAVAIHNRINVAIEKIGELKGQVGEIARRDQ